MSVLDEEGVRRVLEFLLRRVNIFASKCRELYQRVRTERFRLQGTESADQVVAKFQEYANYLLALRKTGSQRVTSQQLQFLGLFSELCEFSALLDDISKRVPNVLPSHDVRARPEKSEGDALAGDADHRTNSTQGAEKTPVPGEETTRTSASDGQTSEKGKASSTSTSSS